MFPSDLGLYPRRILGEAGQRLDVRIVLLYERIFEITDELLSKAYSTGNLIARMNWFVENSEITVPLNHRRTVIINISRGGLFPLHLCSISLRDRVLYVLAGVFFLSDCRVKYHAPILRSKGSNALHMAGMKHNILDSLTGCMCWDPMERSKNYQQRIEQFMACIRARAMDLANHRNNLLFLDTVIRIARIFWV